MKRLFVSLLLMLCLFCACEKAEETPVEIPQELPIQEQEESEKPMLTVPEVNRDTEITDEIVRDLLIFLGLQETEDGRLYTSPDFAPLHSEWPQKDMTEVCCDWYQMKMIRQYTDEELDEKYAGSDGRQYEYDWYYPAEELIPEVEKYFDIYGDELKRNEDFYHKESDSFVQLGDAAGFGGTYTVESWERFEDKLSISLSSVMNTGLSDEEVRYTLLTIRLENNRFRYISHQCTAPQVDETAVQQILTALTEDEDSNSLKVKDWTQIDRLLYIDLYNEILQQDSRLTAVYHEDNGDWDWHCISYGEAEQEKQYTAQLTVHESYEGDALSEEKMDLQFTLPDGISLKETFSEDGQVQGLFLYYGAEHLGRISVYKDAKAEFFNSKAEPWPLTTDFADLTAEMNRGCYRHITDYPAKEFWPFERGIAYYLNLDSYCMDVWVQLECSEPQQQELVEELLSSLSVCKTEPQEALTKTVQMAAENYTGLDYSPVMEIMVPEKAVVGDVNVSLSELADRAESFSLWNYSNGQDLSQADLEFIVSGTRAFRWFEIKGQKALVSVQEAMYSDNTLGYIYIYYLPLTENSNQYLKLSILSEVSDVDLAIAEQREFVQSIRLIKLQGNGVPIPEEALTAQQKELVHIVESLDIMGLTVSESMPENEKGIFFLWLINQEEYVNADKWKDDNGTYKIPLRDIESILGERTMITEIDPVSAFPYNNYDEKTQYLYLDELGGYGGARAHGLISVEEDENRTKIELGSYDMETFWNEPPTYTLLETITAEFEFQWGEWVIVEMSRNKAGTGDTWWKELNVAAENEGYKTVQKKFLPKNEKTLTLTMEVPQDWQLTEGRADIDDANGIKTCASLGLIRELQEGESIEELENPEGMPFALRSDIVSFHNKLCLQTTGVAEDSAQYNREIRSYNFVEEGCLVNVHFYITKDDPKSDETVRRIMDSVVAEIA